MTPELAGFSYRQQELRAGLAVAERLRRASGAEVEVVERVTPEDYAVTLNTVDGSYVVRVSPGGSLAERRWCEIFVAGRAPAPWADLRFDHHMVIAEEWEGR